MRFRKLPLAGFMLMLAAATELCAAPAAGVPFGRLLSDADDVVVANTNSAISTGSGIALTLSVLRVVKGSSFAPGASIHSDLDIEMTIY